MIPLLVEWLRGLSLGLNKEQAQVIAVAVGALAIIMLSYLANLVAKRLLLRLVTYLVSRTSTKWDDAFVKRRAFLRLSHLAPAIVIYLVAPEVLVGFPGLTVAVQRLTQIYMIVAGLLVIDAVLTAANDIYSTFESAKQVPIKGFIQVLKVLLYGVGGIVVLAILINKTPLYLLSGLGALAAVMMLVFKDPILGFVGGIQLSANKMVAIGDWIEMPSHDADGDVIEVALTTVKVQNFDKTITTIPTYDLISRPFKNWQGMRESGGRRIRRAIHIDMSSIRFCDEEMLKRFLKIQFIRDYLDEKKRELAEHNELHDVDDASLVNGRRLTNVGTFRAYIKAYLRNHPRVRQDMTFLVRQLEPSKHGLPIQIYVFTDDVRWENYEDIQGDILDHLLAVVPEFDLRVYQDPTGRDMREGLHG
jgi:miniconductance mechanosensitive channel